MFELNLLYVKKKKTQITIYTIFDTERHYMYIYRERKRERKTNKQHPRLNGSYFSILGPFGPSLFPLP